MDMDLSRHDQGENALPIPISSKYGGDHSHGHTSNGPSSTTDGSAHTCNNGGGRKAGAVTMGKYRECMKNHAASIGGNATDGCGEFMPGGEDGSPEALRCSACGCHRNFHRKEAEGEDYSPSLELCHYRHARGRPGAAVVGQKGVDAFCYAPPPLAPSPHQLIMPLGAMQTSESDEMEGVAGGFSRHHHYHHHPMVRKRFRTKFTPEQKEKMLSFAEKVGWRLQKQEESMVHQFCQEIGVKRRVLKVWMHNNKHIFAKKNNIHLD